MSYKPGGVHVIDLHQYNASVSASEYVNNDARRELDDLKNYSDNLEADLPSVRTTGMPSLEKLKWLHRFSRTAIQNLTEKVQTGYKNHSSIRVLLASLKSLPNFAQSKRCPVTTEAACR